MSDANITRTIGMVKNYDNILSCFHLIPERHGQTHGRTDRIAILISRVSMLMRDKNSPTQCLWLVL